MSHKTCIFTALTLLLPLCVVASFVDDRGFCTDFPCLTNGDISYSQDADQVTVTAACDVGFKFEGLNIGETITAGCQASVGTWSRDSFPQCVEARCEAQSPENAEDLDCQDVGSMVLCSIKCRDGYRASSATMFACTKATGEWNPPLPEKNRFPNCIQGHKQCKSLSPPINGHVACNVTDDEQRCFPTCPPGFKFSSVIPDSGFYHCDVNGRWQPSSLLPQCMEDPDAVNLIGQGHYSGIYTKVKTPASQAGICYTWGQHHYRTFDGTVYRFSGDCSYVLAKDQTSGKFTIHVKNDGNCDGSATSCTRSVVITYGDDQLTLQVDSETKEASAYGDGMTKLFLPEYIYGLSVEKIADYLVVKSDDNVFSVKWDGAEQIWVHVADTMYGKTSGLCGTFNRNNLDDLTIYEGNNPKLVSDIDIFANAWKASLTCANAASQPFCKFGDSANLDDRLMTGRALVMCSAIMSSKCKDVVDPVPFFESCKEDVCFYRGDEGSVCASMAAYFRECSRRGVHVDWREPGRCPASCPIGMVFDQCGSSCPLTCSGREYNCEDKHCIDGCHCPQGTYLYDGQCVEKTSCPCLFGEKSYQPKSKIRRDCNQCVCARGKWVCTRNTCDGICRSFSDSHYQTFDGTDFNVKVEQDCSYILARSSGNQDICFEIVVESERCQEVDQQTGLPAAHCTRHLIVTVNGKTIKLLSGGMVFHEGKELKLPHILDNVSVEQVTSVFQKVTIWNGMTILWDTKTRIFIRAKDNMCGRMNGLCGNFDSIQENDKWASDGITHEDVYEFASLWQTDVCEGAPRSDPMREHPCKVYSINKPQAKEFCSRLKNPPFLQCHDIVEYQTYYDACMYEFCTIPSSVSACDIFGTYAMACQKQGVVFDWREGSDCEVTCPTGSCWSECANSCEASCGAIQNEIPCTEQCVPGCTCDVGQVFDYNGVCIEVKDCPCFFEGSKYLPGESHMQDCNICECHMGKWQCTDNYCPPNESCGENQEFVSCKWEKAITCFSMHLPIDQHKKPDRCRSGCQCVEGFVLDETTGNCVQKDQCPCIYGGRSYQEGEIMRKDCNNCQCSGGRWTCTEKICRGSCHAYGASHITTFDHHSYKFGQSCEYVLARSTADNPHSFQVTITNVPCGTYGTVCSKSISIMVKNGTEEETLILHRGKEVEIERAGAFEKREVGLSMFIDTHIGVTLQWDKGTHIIVKLSEEHAGKVEGLCGNYDQNSRNDFMTSDGLETSDKLDMAKSWQLGTCWAPTSVDDVDGCSANPGRRTWSEARCSVIKTTFAECHKYVNPEPYYERCVFDTCACNSGGECECFCTAVAAYAQECNRHGANIYWRSQEMCPIQCDGYRAYNPCVSACPVTCDNYAQRAKIEAECKDACVEGCGCKGKLIYDTNEGCCVERSQCLCKAIDGIAYGEGDKIWSMSDECKSCYCMDHGIHCLGLPCPDSYQPPCLPSTIKYWEKTEESGRYDPYMLRPSEETCVAEVGRAIESCPPSRQNPCGYKCQSLCHAWRAATYECIHGNDDTCCFTCGQQVTQCPPGLVLRDEGTCIAPKDCPCILQNGNILAPGDNWDCRATCTRYYCWDNVLEESVIQDCVSEEKAIEVHEDISSEYPSYTAIAMKYPEEEIVEETPATEDTSVTTTTVETSVPTTDLQVEVVSSVQSEPAPSINQMLSIFDAAISSPNYGEGLITDDAGEDGIVGGLSVPDFSYEIVDDATVCMDASGLERSYGECWRKLADPCQICTCYDHADVRCESVECEARPMCSFGQRLVSEDVDGCCRAYRCVERDCNEMRCSPAPSCKFYETLITQTIDGCCATYKCQCEEQKCMQLGDAECPLGSVRMEVDPEICCPVKKCVKVTREENKPLHNIEKELTSTESIPSGTFGHYDDNYGNSNIDKAIVYSDMDKDFGDLSSTTLAVGPAPHAHDRPLAGGYPSQYGPVASDSGKPFAPQSSPMGVPMIIGGMPAPEDTYYGEDEVLSDGNKFDVPFMDHAGYLGDDSGVVYENLNKDLGDVSPTRLAVGPAPQAYDTPLAAGYPSQYGPAKSDSGKPFAPQDTPAQSAIYLTGMPAPEDTFFADDEVVTDGHMMNVPFKDNYGYPIDDSGIVYSDMDKDLGDLSPSRLAVGPAPHAHDRPLAGGYPSQYGPVASDSGKPFAPQSSPMGVPMIIGGMPAPEDTYYGEEEFFTDDVDSGSILSGFPADLFSQGKPDFMDDITSLGDLSATRLSYSPSSNIPPLSYVPSVVPSTPTSASKPSSVGDARPQPNTYAFLEGYGSAGGAVSSVDYAVNGTIQVCPGVDMSDALVCPANEVWNGRVCVAPEDCPCITEHNYYTCGSVWKEDNGCTNCICIGGVAKCTQEICEATTCPPGYSSTVLPGDCCPSCLPSDKTCENGLKTIGETWQDNCESCVCLETGTKCSPISCPETEMPYCSDGYELVQKMTGCCPVYECACDYSLCQNVTQPDCGANYEMVAVTVTGSCCPDYRCVCAPERCPNTYCKEGEKKVLVDDSFDCCPQYKCEPIQCTDKMGVVHKAGETFLDPSDHCSQCVCDDNGNACCEKKTCPMVKEPKCRDNSAPTLITTADGCCPMYTCNCVCTGLSSYWTMFDQKLVSSSRTGTFTLIEDVETNDFVVSMNRVDCTSGVCLSSITIEDRVGNHKLTVSANEEIEIDGTTYSLGQSETLRKFGFVVEKGSQTRITLSTINLIASISEDGHSWSISIPHTYQDHVNGLCGSCSATTCISTDVEIGAISDDVIDSYSLVSSSRTYMQLQEATLDDVKLCGQFMANQFASCSVDKLMYLGACASYLSNGGTPCHALSALSTNCRLCDDLCINWRSDALCPVECPSGMSYRACTRTTTRTCDNYKMMSSSISQLTDGCFCSGDMVLSNGTCVHPSTCPVCFDESGSGRYSGESWTNSDNPCVTSTCTCDGNIMQMAARCAPSKRCSANEIERTVDANTCCPATECVPREKCEGVTCPTYETPSCKAGEEIQSIVHDECCVEFVCVCNTGLCPVTPQPTCEVGEVMKRESSECCQSMTCECKPETCPRPPTCSGQGFKLEVVKNGRCCAEYECTCDRSSCPCVEQPTCDVGEKLQVVNPGDCCPRYQCMCDATTCPERQTTCSHGHKLKEVIDHSKCCPITTECECDATQCPVYIAPRCDASKGLKRVATSTRWTHPRQMACCPKVYEEVCTCDSSLCPLNAVHCKPYERTVEVALSSCCTATKCECDTSLCPADNVECNDNQHIEYVDVNGCCKKAQCVCDACPEIVITCKNGWITVDETDSCGCKSRKCSPPNVCVHNGETHDPSSSWFEDVCTECKCSGTPNDRGEYEAECTAIQCGRCSSGYTYVPVPGACCGDCVPVTCHYQGQEHTVGQTWAAKEDTCTTCTCEMCPETGEVYTTCSKTACAPLDQDCPADKIRTTADGCCQYCETDKLNECSIKKTIEETLTIDECSSSGTVELSYCEGACVSSSVYSFEAGNFTRICSCCHAQETEVRTVNLTCPDDSIKTVTYKSATQCGCRSKKCDDDESP